MHLELSRQCLALVGPFEGLGHSAIVVFNKGQGLGLQVSHRGEVASFEKLAHQDAQPDFDMT